MTRFSSRRHLMSARTLTVKVALGILTFASPLALSRISLAQAAPDVSRPVQGGGGNPPGMNGGGNNGGINGGINGGARPNPPPNWDHRPDHGNNGNNFSYLPWVSGGFGPYYPADSGS